MADHSKPTASPAGHRAFQAAAWIVLGVAWAIKINVALGLAIVGLGLGCVAYASWRDQQHRQRQ